MCGRFILTGSGEEVAEAFGLDEAPALLPRYNIAPSQPVLVVRQVEPHGERSMALPRWGLVPRVARYIGEPGAILGPTDTPALRYIAPEGKPLINARAETAATRGVFRSAFAHGRCLVPTNGFYEWQGEKGSKRQPFHLRLQGGGLFGLAGLVEPGLEPDTWTLAILTTSPNALVEKVHDRMPLILPSTEYARWLDPGSTAATLRPLLGPYPAARMEAWPVGGAVNNARLDDPSCLAPLPT
jgi:putative SOS response-associated peptidase YedK